MDQKERDAEMDRVAAESPLHDYIRLPREATWGLSGLFGGLDLDRPSRLTPDLLERRRPVRFDEVGMTPERDAALRARAKERFDARRAEVPIIPRDKA